MYFCEWNIDPKRLPVGVPPNINMMSIYRGPKGESDMYHRPEVFGDGILHQINLLESLNHSENETFGQEFPSSRELANLQVC